MGTEQAPMGAAVAGALPLALVPMTRLVIVSLSGRARSPRG